MSWSWIVSVHPAVAERGRLKLKSMRKRQRGRKWRSPRTAESRLKPHLPPPLPRSWSKLRSEKNACGRCMSESTATPPFSRVSYSRLELGNNWDSVAVNLSLSTWHNPVPRQRLSEEEKMRDDIPSACYIQRPAAQLARCDRQNRWCMPLPLSESTI